MFAHCSQEKIFCRLVNRLIANNTHSITNSSMHVAFNIAGYEKKCKDVGFDLSV